MCHLFVYGVFNVKVDFYTVSCQNIWVIKCWLEQSADLQTFPINLFQEDN